MAGPIVRRVTTSEVAVWIALREPREVTLSLHRVNGARIHRGRRSHTIEVGPRLHLAVAIIRGVALTPGTRYGYDLELTVRGKSPLSILDPKCVKDAKAALCLTGCDRPTFVVPPDKLEEIDIVHGSCRMPHGPPPDLLAQLAPMLDAVAIDGSRPQQLLLTGDQIYADDVAGPLLASIIELADDLFATSPKANRAPVRVGGAALPESDLSPYQRESLAGLLVNPGDVTCHLARFEEFAAMYLMVWSDAVWPSPLPTDSEVGAIATGIAGGIDGSEKAHWDRDRERLRLFHDGVRNVRRALANIATYMICDDHEIADDWYIDALWTRKVLGDPDGKTIVRRGLAAYALFQAWGNDPDAVLPAIDAISRWRARSLKETALDGVLGLPSGTVLDGGHIKRDQHKAVRWSYTVPGPVHRLAVLDTRTRRVFTGDSMALVPPDEIAPIVRSTGKPSELTIVVSPSGIIEPPPYEVMRLLARHSSERASTRKFDAEMWLASSEALAALVEALFAEKRALVVSGDVHYGYAGTLDREDSEDSDITRHVPCFICSPLLNSFVGDKRASLTVIAPPWPDGQEVSRYGTPMWDGQLGRVQIRRFDGVLAVHHTWYFAHDKKRTLNLAFESR
ncbi:MAG TPA: hypothetical protein VM261_35855 [Kofleriaceae bacterium]|nr:hypothetical protein [Kofleriaceae bacterium]